MKTRPEKSYCEEAYKITKGWMDGLPYYCDPESGELVRKQVLPRWLDALDKLHRLDRHDWKDIRELAEWVVQDTGNGKWSGWASVCESPMKLRKKNGDGVPYFEVISRHMRNNKSRPVGRPLPPVME